MAYIPLNLPPGVFRNGTAYQAKGRWYDVNLVRWRNSRLQPVGGWQRVTTNPFAGKIRALHGWRDNSYARWMAIGTNEGLYVYQGDAFENITPIGFVTGRENSLYGLGYSAGMYGEEAYGTERSATGLILEAATWHLDNWGENLVGCAPHDGKLYEFDASAVPIADAAQIANSPTDCRGLIVTEERHLVALGAGGNPRKVAWSDQEDNTTWTASATNTAGDFELVTPGLIQCARRMPGQIIIWTDVDAHVMRYAGSPFVYSRERVGNGCGIIGPQAHMSIGNAVVWMGDRGFYIFDGVVKPLFSEVHDYVFEDINVLQGAKVAAGHLSELGEVWFFYPSATSVENDRYVIWNYRENHWSIGQLSRTAWLDADAFTYPFAASGDKHLYEHEHGWTDNGATRTDDIYAKSAAIEIADGERLMSVRQLVPDDCGTSACVEVEFEVQQTPSGSATTYGPYALDQADGYTDARFTGRQVEMTVRPTEDGSFTFGTLRLDAVAGSRR